MAAAGEDKQRAGADGRPLILVADDDEQVRDVVSRVLRHGGYETFAASDGAEALSCLREQSVDLVLTDVRMPRMNGLELAREIRANHPHVPVIMMTAFADLDAAQAAAELGVAGYLKKPFGDIKDVRSTVARVLAERSDRSVAHTAKQAQDGTRRRLERAAEDLKSLQTQFLRQEKLASLGQLAAGIAHELNNPIGFIVSNLNTLGQYGGDVLRLVTAYRKLAKWANTCDFGEGKRLAAKVRRVEEDVDVHFIIDDLIPLIQQSKEGAERVHRIVTDLKTFSHPGGAERDWSDINAGLESTVNIAWNAIKYKAAVVKELGEIPKVFCDAGQLNQVFLNLIMNAAQAIEQKGVITIRTWSSDSSIYVKIADTGRGMSPEVKARIFEPFFTTKPVGQGTGLGLSVAYGIVTRHGGEMDVESTPGVGTTLTIQLPIRGKVEEDGG